MPRPGPRRPLTALRIAEEEIESIDQRARDEGLLKGDGTPNRSEMIRVLTSYAISYMPRGWRPDAVNPSFVTVPVAGTSNRLMDAIVDRLAQQIDSDVEAAIEAEKRKREDRARRQAFARSAYVTREGVGRRL